MASLPDFKKLWDAYPTGAAPDVKTQIGGRVDADWVANTCAIRLSRALNYAGAPVPLGLTRFGGHPETFTRGAADAEIPTTVFA